MTYLHLLSPQGEPFEVTETRAKKLLTEGWSFNPAPLSPSDSVFTPVEEPEESNGAIADAEDQAISEPIPTTSEPTVEPGPDQDDEAEQYEPAVTEEEDNQDKRRGKRR